MLLLPGPSKSQEQKLEVVGKNEEIGRAHV